MGYSNCVIVIVIFRSFNLICILSCHRFAFWRIIYFPGVMYLACVLMFVFCASGFNISYF